MNRKRPRSVFVPYETVPGIRVPIRARDLPRFVEPHQVVEFLHKRTDLSKRLLDWREEFDTASIDEYMSGVGETEKPLPQLITFTERKH